jgi:chromosome partitioning protein
MEPTIHDVLVGRVDLQDTIVTVEEEGFDLVPSNIDLAGAEAYLLARTAREYTLREAIEDELVRYQAVIVDCPPSLGVLTINALTAADQVLIPLQCETLSHRGVGQLLSTISDIRRLTNPRLRVVGLLPTMYDGRTRHARQVLEQVGEEFGVPVLPPVPKSIRFAEAPAAGVSIVRFTPTHPGAQAYRDLSRELVA